MVELSPSVIGCSLNMKNHIFYFADSNYGALIYIEEKIQFKFFSWLLR